MPRVKMCEVTVNGVTIQGQMTVDRRGEFKIVQNDIPTSEDSRLPLTIAGKTLEEVEMRWREAVRAYGERVKTERKVIVVRFDSKLRPNWKQSFGSDRQGMLQLEVGIFTEVCIQRGERRDISYLDPYIQHLFAGENPFPIGMRMASRFITQYQDTTVIVAWTQELENLLVRACLGVKAVVATLDQALRSEQNLLEALASGNNLGMPELPAQPQERDGKDQTVQSGD